MSLYGINYTSLQFYQSELLLYSKRKHAYIDTVTRINGLIIKSKF